jgi:hypothetical protein
MTTVVTTITAFFARCAIVGLGGPPRYEEQPIALWLLAQSNWFKCYRYFRVEEAAYFSQSASPAFGWRGAYAIRALPDLCSGITSERLGHLDP